MVRTSWPLKSYIAIVVILGIMATVASFWLFPVDTTIQKIVLAIGLAATIAVAGAYPIKLTDKMKANVSAAPIFAAVLVLQPGTAVAAAVLGTGAAEIFRRKPVRQVLFNTGMISLYVGIAGIVFRSMGADATLSFNTELSIERLLATVAVIYIVNRLAVTGIAGIQTGNNPLRLWRQNWKEDLVQESALFATGLLVALAVQQWAWSLLLLVVPTVIVYRSFAKIVKLNQKVESQMEELKIAQGQLIETAKMAAIGTLSAGIAHQINNPIFAIRGTAELLLGNADKHLKTAKAQQHLESIYQMADRVGRIVKCLLTPSRPSEDGIRCTTVHEVLENVLVLMESRFKELQIRVVRDYEEQLPLVRGDGAEIQELFMNIVRNSCDSMPGGGELKLVTRSRNSSVDIDIIDKGIGIPPENLGRIFDPFFTTKEVGQGIGLGLFVVKEIVQKHGGHVSVESEPGKGSKFTVSLPIVTDGENPENITLLASDKGSPLPLRSQQV